MTNLTIASYTDGANWGGLFDALPGVERSLCIIEKAFVVRFMIPLHARDWSNGKGFRAAQLQDTIGAIKRFGLYDVKDILASQFTRVFALQSMSTIDALYVALHTLFL